MDNAKIIDRLNDLIHLDIDAISAYDSAIRACEHESVAAPLRQFRSDHERHVRDLAEEVRALGGTPSERRDLKGFLIKGFTAIASRGTHSALMVMRGNEELTNRIYQKALKEELPDGVREVVELNYSDERRHLEWIQQALDQRVWEQGELGTSA
jgi:uncharacterized protein (TIGR02284 family)